MGFTDNYTKKKLSPTTTELVKRKIQSNEVQSTTDESILLSICGDDDDDDINKRRSLLIPDQEILDSTEEIYFQENVDTGTYELNVSGTHLTQLQKNISIIFSASDRPST